MKEQDYDIDTFTKEQVYELLLSFSGSLNFKDPFHVCEFDKIIKKFFNETIFFQNIFHDNNIILSRVRKHENPKTKFSKVEDIWYPPIGNIAVGRANLVDEQVFYCSNYPGTSIFEMRPQIGDWLTSIEINIRKENLDCLVMGINHENVNTISNIFSEKNKGINMFLETKFKEVVPDDKKYLYYQTAIFVNRYSKGKDGVIYPSRASNLKGWNFALKKEIVDKYGKVSNATIHEVIEYKNEYDFKVKCLYKSNAGKLHDNFAWERIIDCKGHDLNEQLYSNHSS